ncbi:MAG: hypothetical protein EXX96DRAFT_294286 [Benjaminiella poitrasii]|nr:MAG: hypothetical protein EXX96DRAFT_294286 [Benjaminiella poitrasii]
MYQTGLQQLIMRSVIFQQIISALFACLASITTIDFIPYNLPSVVKKSSSIVSLGSQLLPSKFSSNNTVPSSPSISSVTSILIHGEQDNSDGGLNPASRILATIISYKTCTLIFELLSTLCLASVASGYDVVINILSEVKGEQYRFERLVQNIQRLYETYYDQQDNISDDHALLIFDCLTAALSLFNNIVRKPDVIEKRDSLRMELERRGFEELVTRLEAEKESLPESLQKQVSLYHRDKKVDQDKISALQNAKRQSLLQL